MKFYCFYIYVTNLNTKLYPALNYDEIKEGNNFMYSLYGYTNNKKLANKFRETRNMEIFFEKVIHMDKTEYKNLCESNIEGEIKYNLYKIFSINNDKIRTELMFIISTGLEYDIMCFDYPVYLNKLFVNVYDKLTYIYPTDFDNVISTILQDIFVYYDVLDLMKNIDTLPMYSFDVNSSSLYFQIFGNTYNQERMYEACIYGDSLRNPK